MHLWGIAYKCLFQESRFSMLVGWPWTIFFSIIFVPSNLTLLHMVTPISPNFWLKNPRVSQDFSDFCSKNHPIFRVLTLSGFAGGPLNVGRRCLRDLLRAQRPRGGQTLWGAGPARTQWMSLKKDGTKNPKLAILVGFCMILYDFSGTWCRFYEWDLTLPQKLGFAFAWDTF